MAKFRIGQEVTKTDKNGWVGATYKNKIPPSLGPQFGQIVTVIDYIDDKFCVFAEYSEFIGGWNEERFEAVVPTRVVEAELETLSVEV